MDEIREAIHDVVAAENPMTVRQVFYRLVTTGVIEKSENEYNSTVVRLLTQMRLDHNLPFDWIADNTRWMRKPRSHSNLRSALDNTARAYRRALWDDQNDYVEIWLEKEALAGVVYDVTGTWDVPLMVTRGYPSISFLHEAAEAIDEQEKHAHLYYFGDWDPSGLDIARVVRERLDGFAASDISFHRVAVTPEQVKSMGLPTRPTKITDTRSKSFKGASIELDAIPPRSLRDVVRTCIKQHVDPEALEKTKQAERSERELLSRWDEALQAIGGQDRATGDRT